MVILFDTSAWIEFFEGTEKGKVAQEYLKSKEVFTSIVTLAELINWCLKSNKEEKIKAYIDGIKNGSNI